MPEAEPPPGSPARPPAESGALKPVGGGGRAFLGVRRMEPHDDGVHLIDDAGALIEVIAYGERVYINGRVISFGPVKG